MNPTESGSSRAVDAVDSPGGAAVALDDPRLIRALEEYRALLDAGQKPDRHDFLASYPEISQALADCLDGLEFIHTAAPQLHQAAQEPSPSAGDGDIPAEGPLGDFRLVREIGRGGMGVVYEAVQISLGRRVALKVLPFAAALDARQLQRFKNEAQAAAFLHHQNIVPVFAVGQERGVHYYAMQFIEGPTLARIIADLKGKDDQRDPALPSKATDQPAQPASQPTGPYQAHALPPIENRKSKIENTTLAAFSTEGSTRAPAFFRTAARLGVQAAEALEHAHQRGVIHRDIKPANLMVEAFAPLSPGGRGAGGEGLRLWIADFGLAHCQSQSGPTLTGDLVGTLRYMSPEQALAKRVPIDHRTDVYSLGATLYELLTLQPAFVGGDRQELLRQIAFEEPRPPRRLNKAIPVELETIVLKALEKNPAERYATAQELAEDLERFLKDEPIRAKRPTLGQRTRKWARRHRAAVWAGAAVLVVALFLAGGNWLYWAQRRAAADGAVGQALAEAQLLREQAKEKPLGDGSSFREALGAARKAEDLALASDASGELRKQAADLAALVQGEAQAADLDRRLLVRLLDVRQPREAPRYHVGSSGQIVELAEPTADEQFAAAFRDWGLDVDGTSVAEATARLKARPAAVQTEVAAALDEWASERRRQVKPQAAWQRLADLAAALDGRPDSRRRELRAILTRGKLPLERALGELSQAVLPMAALTGVVPGPDRNRLRRLAEETDAANEPVLGLLTLARALQVAGDSALAERLLGQAVLARPAEVVLHNALGKLLGEQRPPAWGRAVECYKAARALRPELGVALAEALAGSGRAYESLALLARLVTEQPGNPWLHFERGWALADQGRHKEAEAAARKAIHLKPPFAEAHNLLGIALDSQGKYAEGETACREAIRLKPDLAQAYCNLGYALSAQGRDQEAEAAVGEAIRLNRDDAVAHSNLGNYLNAQGRYKEGEAACREAIRLKPDYVEAHNNLGYALIHQRRYKEAETAVREAIRLKPQFAEAHNNLGVCFREQGRNKEGETAYREAISLKPDYAAAHSNLGLVLTDCGRYHEAEAAHRKAIALKPNLAVLHFNLGCNLASQRRYKEAEEAYREAIDLTPNLAAVHYNLGTLLCNQGRYKEAEAALGEAIRLKPDSAKAHNNLGYALIHQRRYKEAETAEREAIRLEPDSAVARTNLGLTLIHQHRYQQAEAAFREAIRLAPESYGGYTGLAWLRATCPDPRFQDPSEAVRLAKKGVALAPTVGNSWNALGVAQYRAKDWKAAIAALEKSMEFRHDVDCSDYFFLAMSHWQLREKEKARKWYHRAVDWMDKNQPQNEELRRFRAEAAALLGVKEENK
jgi:Flp pilus assembly protein TadD/serine/threonine protein kinase